MKSCSLKSSTVSQNSNNKHVSKALIFELAPFRSYQFCRQRIPKSSLTAATAMLDPGIGHAWIHTGFHRFTEIGRIFHNKYIFLLIKMLSKLKSGKSWSRLASYPLQYGNWPWWYNPAICKAWSSEENGTSRCPEPHGKGTSGPELKSTKRRHENLDTVKFRK